MDPAVTSHNTGGQEHLMVPQMEIKENKKEKKHSVIILHSGRWRGLKFKKNKGRRRNTEEINLSV